MVSYASIEFLYVFIPAMLSLFFCGVLILSVAVQPPLRDRIYHRLSVALASTQIIMYSSLLLGNKHDASLAVCKLQDYTFQFGQMLGTATITVINAYVFYVLYSTTVPNESIFVRIYAGMMALCVLLVVISIAFDVASLLCGNDEDSSFASEDVGHNGTRTQRIVLDIVYLYPLVGLLLINVVFFCYCVFQIIFKVKENKFMLPLLKRLLTFTLVVLLCGMPKFISMFFVEGNLFANISNSILHSSGVFLSLPYFYYSVVQDKRRWETRALLRTALLTQSSTPADMSYHTHSEQLDNSSSFSTTSTSSTAPFYKSPLYIPPGATGSNGNSLRSSGTGLASDSFRESSAFSISTATRHSVLDEGDS